MIVSPAQKRQPLISSVGPWINVELRDTLRDSMTYTIDFGDAITDLNGRQPPRRLRLCLLDRSGDRHPLGVGHGV